MSRTSCGYTSPLTFEKSHRSIDSGKSGKKNAEKEIDIREASKRLEMKLFVNVPTRTLCERRSLSRLCRWSNGQAMLLLTWFESQ